jgi:hypothetical protein
VATSFIVSVRSIGEGRACVWWHPDPEHLEAVIKQKLPLAIPTDVSLIYLRDPDILCRPFFATGGGLVEMTVSGNQLIENAVIDSVKRWLPTGKENQP